MSIHHNPDAADLSRYVPEPAQPVANPCDPYDDSVTWVDYYRKKAERTGVFYYDIGAECWIAREADDRLCHDGQPLPDVEPEMFDAGIEPEDYR